MSGLAGFVPHTVSAMIYSRQAIETGISCRPPRFRPANRDPCCVQFLFSYRHFVTVWRMAHLRVTKAKPVRIGIRLDPTVR
jgi:hypothetical protein